MVLSLRAPVLQSLPCPTDAGVEASRAWVPLVRLLPAPIGTCSSTAFSVSAGVLGKKALRAPLGACQKKSSHSPRPVNPGQKDKNAAPCLLRPIGSR